ncbi:amidohydrolase family protein [Oceanicoccus sp. KOV_DT_Chl]|uniref:amidohydrolase family protein n=1 Tax=Oceanicoccus sp. KOV_DT_Chl TaxID=1904639 RepID=UPI000C7E72FA|nr:amidohydrolase family protein [Oceanicoccus sp. KOV_DT_Chl]
MDRYIVVSSDCHAGLPADGYRQYLDPGLRETFDQVLPIQIEMIKNAEKSFLIQEINEEWRKDIQQELTGAWDYDQRIKMLDNDGIAAEIIFPDGITEQNTPPFGAGLGLPTENIVPELQWAGARAHNRWLAELVANNPARHLGVAAVPLLWDIDEAIKEVKWCADNGLRSVLIPHMTNQFSCYHHTRYHPFWQACEALNIVVNFHSGATPQKNYFGEKYPEDLDKEHHPGAMGVFVSEVMWWTYRPISFMLWGGVFEKFPKLKVAITEAGTAWMIPPMLRMLDHNYHDVMFSAKLGDFTSHLSMSPSDYFRRNVGIGASCMPRPDAEVRHDIGLDQIMWGSDYPHPEGTWPKTKSQLYDTFVDLPETEVAAMLGENAVRFYGLDRDALAAIAANIGPTKSELKSA